MAVAIAEEGPSHWHGLELRRLGLGVTTSHWQFSFFRHQFQVAYSKNHGLSRVAPRVFSLECDTTITTYEFYPEAVPQKSTSLHSKDPKKDAQTDARFRAQITPSGSKQPLRCQCYMESISHNRAERRLLRLPPGHCRRRPVLSSHSSGTNKIDLSALLPSLLISATLQSHCMNTIRRLFLKRVDQRKHAMYRIA